MENTELKEKVSHLPTTPGVYLWKDQYKRIIYVGKAINLRNRVRSYIRDDGNRSVKVKSMMNHAVDVEIIQTKTEMEALILENTLIKEHQPKYNIMLRDDKTYPYVKITVQEKFPRVFMTRRITRDGAKYFGPFTDVGAVYRILDVLHTKYPLRTCRSMRVERPCLQYHMHRCEAPCFEKISQENYAKYIDEIINLFEGRETKLISSIKADMIKASEELRFEDAATYRDQLKAIDFIREKQRVVTEKGEIDVVGLVAENNMICVQIFFVRTGKLIGRENFFIPDEGTKYNEVLAEFLKQYYSGNTFLPKEILLPMPTEDDEIIAEWLTSRKGQKVNILIPQRGYKKDLVKMAIANATTFLEERKRQWQYKIDKTTGAVKKLAEVLDLPRLPERMECFDISHFQGSQTVASMTVFEGGKPAKKEYRRFKLKTVQGKPDDFASMAEIMERRYNNEKDWPMPDLIIIDGGKGQLSAALPVIRRMGVVDVPVIALAERIDEIFIEGQKESIVLSHHSPELQLLQQIRNEAHRFAITYHRKLRSKKQATSILDHIPGIGPKRRKAIWNHFKTLDEIKAASVDELAKLDGMNLKSAEAVYNFFRLSKAEKQNIIEIN